MVTQVNESHLRLPLDEQRHEPLAFLGSEFKKLQVVWTTYEKEAFAIFQAFKKLDYLFLNGKKTRVFTDHRNFLFVFSPLTLEPSLGKHVVAKVLRWEIYLSAFDFAIEHIEGVKNVFADILTRWARGHRRERQMRAVFAIVETTAIVHASPDDIQWPSRDEILNAQSSSQTQKPKKVKRSADGLLKLDSATWIPKDAKELQLRIIIARHGGIGGHRGQYATRSAIAESFVWHGIQTQVDHFLRRCIHCIVSRSGEKIPWPLAHALNGLKPNEVLHMDFLYMGDITEGLKYLLLLRDDLSSYTWLYPTTEATAASAAAALSMWVGSFGSMDWLVSDQGIHFKNELISELTKDFHVQHNFTVAYSPWSNGSVERVCHEVLRACTALRSEWLLGEKYWPAVSECVQSILNHPPLRILRLRDPNCPSIFRTPLEVFTGMRPSLPLLRALQYCEYHHLPSISEVRARQKSRSTIFEERSRMYIGRCAKEATWSESVP